MASKGTVLIPALKTYSDQPIELEALSVKLPREDALTLCSPTTRQEDIKLRLQECLENLAQTHGLTVHSSAITYTSARK